MGGELPKSCEVVIIGGGVIGCSIAYHLTKAGISDVVLLERKKLTSGTTWHAAGLVGQLRTSLNMTRLAQYTAELYTGLEDETGQATGFKQNGSLSLALHEGRMEEFRRNASMAKGFGLQVDVLSVEEVAERYPLANVDGGVGGIFIPTDGQTNPADVTLALAKGARMGGAKLFEDTKVIGITLSGDRVTGVKTEEGEIKARWVVLATGMWSRDMAGEIGVTLPLHACEHFYIVTEPFAGVTSDLPVFRVYDECAYYKEDAGKILLGAFEPKAKPWGMNGIPEDFEFDALPDDFDHFEPILESAINRMPALADAGIQTFFNGPESFTPDNRYNIGPAPEVQGLMVAAGLNSIGIQSAGGIGKVLASWIKDDQPPMDLWDVDVRRQMPFQVNKRYLQSRVSETLGLLYATHWPFYQYETARGVRRSPFHDKHKEAGACFGEVAGYERPNWFAPEGTEPGYEYSYGRQNWFDASAAEHRAAREGAALFDLSSFAKFLVQGRDAAQVLERVSANKVAGDIGRAVYTQWLNDRGGIEADLTVTRMAEDTFLVVTSAGSQVRDFHWLRRAIREDEFCTVADVGSSLAVLAVNGPKTREVLSQLTPADLSNEAFPFGTSKEIDLAMARVRATRISYAGELGWELYVGSEFAAHVYDAVIEAGAEVGLVPAGMHALNSLRIEKAFRHWGHDITDEDTPLEAGLGFAVNWDKPGGFIGREALLKQKEAGTTRTLLQFKLEDPEALIYHNEPIWRGDEIVGHITSAMYGHTLGGCIGLGYVSHEAGAAAEAASASYAIEVAGVRIPAQASRRPLYDPKSLRPRDVAGT